MYYFYCSRPNIPNYTGCTWYRPETVPAHSNNTAYPGTPQTATAHRYDGPLPYLPMNH